MCSVSRSRRAAPGRTVRGGEGRFIGLRLLRLFLPRFRSNIGKSVSLWSSVNSLPWCGGPLQLLRWAVLMNEEFWRRLLWLLGRLSSHVHVRRGAGRRHISVRLLRRRVQLLWMRLSNDRRRLLLLLRYKLHGVRKSHCDITIIVNHRNAVRELQWDARRRTRSDRCMLRGSEGHSLQVRGR